MKNDAAERPRLPTVIFHNPDISKEDLGNLIEMLWLVKARSVRLDNTARIWAYHEAVAALSKGLDAAMTPSFLRRDYERFLPQDFGALTTDQILQHTCLEHAPAVRAQATRILAVGEDFRVQEIYRVDQPRTRPPRLTDPVTTEELLHLASELRAKNVLPIVVVYDHPSDRPDAYVARLWEVDKATEHFAVSADLEELRRPLRDAGFGVMPRTAIDEPQIVEVWL